MQKILIIDSSVDFTGAFKAALQQVEILNEQYSFIFIVSTGSNTANILKQKGFAAGAVLIRRTYRDLSESDATLINTKANLSNSQSGKSTAILASSDTSVINN